MPIRSTSVMAILVLASFGGAGCQFVASANNPDVNELLVFGILPGGGLLPRNPRISPIATDRSIPFESRVWTPLIAAAQGRFVWAGGSSYWEIPRYVEVYDSTKGVWSRIGALSPRINGNMNVTLPDGRVLMTGGYSTEVGGTWSDSVYLVDAVAGTITPGPTLPETRANHGGVLLSDGRVLIYSGRDVASTVLADARILASPSGPWGPPIPLPSGGFFGPVVVALPGGKAMVAGGTDPTYAESGTIELFDGATFAVASASLVTPRDAHTVNYLPAQNKVLVFGGYDVSHAGALSSWQLYDVAGGTLSAESFATTARAYHSSVLLNDGRVLVSGGASDYDATGLLDSVSIYDPVLDAFTDVSPMNRARAGHSLVLLADGRVLAVGGLGEGPLGQVVVPEMEIYDPTLDTWTLISARQGRYGNSLVTMSDGRALSLGGSNGEDVIGDATAIDPATGALSELAPLAAPRTYAAGGVFADGKIVVAGGGDLSGELGSVEVYDPAAGTWSSGPSLSVNRYMPLSGMLADGRFLVCGGEDAVGSASASCDLIDSTGSVMQSAVNLTGVARMDSSIIRLSSNGRYFTAGGMDGLLAPVTDAEMYTPVIGGGGTWTSRAPMPTARTGMGLVELKDGRVMAIGGATQYDPQIITTNVVEIYDPTLDSWSAGPSLHSARGWAPAVLLGDGRVLVLGGSSDHSDKRDDAELFDPLTNAWTVVAGLPSQREAPATLLRDGRVLTFGGGGTGLTSLNDGAIFSLWDGVRLGTEYGSGSILFSVLSGLGFVYPGGLFFPTAPGAIDVGASDAVGHSARARFVAQ